MFSSMKRPIPRSMNGHASATPSTPAEHPRHERLADDPERDVPGQKADGAQHAVLARPLAHAHGDRVAEDEHHDDEDDEPR